jgi:hypothetical protein
MIDAVHTRVCTGMKKKNGHNSVTVQNRTHVYMNFFDHKDLGNNVSQLCSKVVKHLVYTHSELVTPFGVDKSSYEDVVCNNETLCTSAVYPLPTLYDKKGVPVNLAYQ